MTTRRGRKRDASASKRGGEHLVPNGRMPTSKAPDSKSARRVPLMKASSDRYWSAVLLLLLLAADLLFVGLQVLHTFGYAGDPRFSLGVERGYGEVYQYVKFFWTTALLSWFAFERREGIYGVGALLFGYFLLDDALGIHETAGRTMVDVLGIPSVLGLRGQDSGELGVSVLVGLFFLGLGGGPIVEVPRLLDGWECTSWREWGPWPYLGSGRTSCISLWHADGPGRNFRWWFWRMGER